MGTHKRHASPAEESPPQVAGECRRLMPNVPSSHLQVYVGHYEINSPYAVEYLRSFFLSFFPICMLLTVSISLPSNAACSAVCENSKSYQ